MNAKFQSSRKIKNIPEALSIYINQLVYAEKRKGIDIIVLSLGEAFFDIPQYSFDEINFAKGYHYSESMGLPELREKILNYYNTHYHTQITDVGNIMISSGSKAIIYMAMESVIDWGDEVLIPEPAWLSYREQAQLTGAVPRFIPYSCDAENFSAYFTDKTKLLILNNPNNPAGWVYDECKLKKVYDECYERGIYIIVDEAYSDFCIEKDEFCSLAKIAKDLEGVFVVNSLSKNMGISGWRIGYVITHKNRMKDLLRLNQHLLTCAPTILQLYLEHYFDEIINITLPQVKEVVQKRKRILNYMDQIGLKYLEGTATFYIFLNINGMREDTLDFCLYLLFKYGIATVPGSAYGESTDKFIRIGIGAEPEERIRYALNTIKTVLYKNLTDAEYVKNKLQKKGFYRFEEERK